MFEILLKAYDLITIYALGILCAAFYLAAGIMVVVKRNTQLISKKNSYSEPETFCLIYGLVEVVGSTLSLVLLLLGMFFQELYILFFVLVAIVVVKMIIILFMINNQFRKR